nr:MAG TPA: hypothetical protein [Caudoviricetes sp.]
MKILLNWRYDYGKLYKTCTGYAIKARQGNY